MRKFDTFYEHLKEYVEEYGDSLVSYRYRSPDGYKLGMTVHHIRGKSILLTDEQEQILDEIPFEWDGRVKRIMPRTFEKYYFYIQKYYGEHGNCNIPHEYFDADGIGVGAMVSRIRTMKDTLNSQQVERLNAIHFVWKYKNKRVSFEKFCKLHREYEKENGHCHIPIGYVTPDEILLGEMVRNIRSGSRKTTQEQKEILNSIGFIWNPNEYLREKKRKQKKKKKDS